VNISFFRTTVIVCGALSITSNLCIPANCAEQATAKFPASEMRAPAFSPDGKELYVGVNKGLVTLDALTGEPKRLLHVPLVPHFMPFSPDRLCFLSPLERKGVVVRSTKNGMPLLVAKAADMSSYLTCLNNRGTMLYVFEKDRPACMSLSRDIEVWRAPRPQAQARSAGFLTVSQDERLLAIGVGDFVHAYDARSGHKIAAVNVDKQYGLFSAEAGVFKKDGSRLLVGGANALGRPFTVLILDTKSFASVQQYDFLPADDQDRFVRLAASDDLSIVAIATSSLRSDTTTIRFWYPKEGNVRILQLKSRGYGMCMSANGQYLAVWLSTRILGFRLSDRECLWSIMQDDNVLTCPEMISAENETPTDKN
jgi:hypothetical protein